MTLEFGDGFCTPCEPTARIWHKGHDPIGRRPIAVVVDVDLPRHQQAEQISRCFTHGISCIERTTTNGDVMSIFKDVLSGHSEWSKMRVRDQDEAGKER